MFVIHVCTYVMYTTYFVHILRQAKKSTKIPENKCENRSIITYCKLAAIAVNY